LIGLPSVAHLTIHWAYTNVGDDPDGKRFSKVREGVGKWLLRRGIEFAAVWCIERMARGQAEVVHCHILFHLPPEYRAARKLQVEAAICRLIKKHGQGYRAEEVIDLRIHENPDGKYLIKGGGPKVWKRFLLRNEHRRLQGIIYGALAWLRYRPVPVIPIIGARKLSQVKDNLASSGVSLSAEQLKMLNEASRIELGFPHEFYMRDMVRGLVYGGMYDRIIA
jgi:hypothetical protein